MVGVSWFNQVPEGVLLWEKPAIEKVIADAGGSFKVADAKSYPETQAADIDSLVAAGAKVIVVQPGLESAILPAVERAAKAGIPVVAIERLIDNPGALYVAFDPVEIGRQEAKALLAAKPTGNYVIVRGDPDQPLSDLIALGIGEALKPAVDKGDIRIVATVSIPHWDPCRAQTEMTTILGNQDKVDAVVVENDGMAGGVKAALKDAGVEGKVAVSGADGDPAGLNRVATGAQAVDVWGNPRQLGEAAGRAAVALCQNADVASVKGSAPFTASGHNLSSILLPPQAITPDNLAIVIDSGWIKRDVVCAFVEPLLAPPACK